MIAASELERILSRMRLVVTGAKMSIFLCPMASAAATVFQAVPLQTSMEYFCTRWPAFSHSIVSARLKVTGAGKSTSSVEWWEFSGADQKVSGLLSSAAETSAEVGV